MFADVVDSTALSTQIEPEIYRTVIGRYRELATSREVSYVEEKGTQCEVHGHRRNHTIPERLTAVLATVAVSKAS